MVDRNRPGILTTNDNGDIVYLLGEAGEMNTHTEDNKRGRIRDRVHSALLDFSILIEHLDEIDRRMVFKEDRVLESLWDTIGFLYLGYMDEFGGDFSTVLEYSLDRAMARRGVIPKSIEVNIDVDSISVEEAEAIKEQRGLKALLDEVSSPVLLTDAGVVTEDEIRQMRDGMSEN